MTEGEIIDLKVGDIIQDIRREVSTVTNTVLPCRQYRVIEIMSSFYTIEPLSEDNVPVQTSAILKHELRQYFKIVTKATDAESRLIKEQRIFKDKKDKIMELMKDSSIEEVKTTETNNKTANTESKTQSLYESMVHNYNAMKNIVQGAETVATLKIKRPEEKMVVSKVADTEESDKKTEEFKNEIMESVKETPIEVEIKDISSLKKGDVVKTLLGSMFYKIGGIYDYGFCIEENTVGGMDFIVSNEIMRNYFKKIVPFTEAVKEKQENRVEHPSHYTWLKELCGIEVIDITRHLNFNVGNCVKYLLRAGRKTEEGISDREKQIEDLKKARFYINDEIEKLSNDEKQ